MGDSETVGETPGKDEEPPVALAVILYPEMHEVTHSWKAAYPGACVGVLAMREVANRSAISALDERKEALEGRREGEGAPTPDVSGLPRGLV